MGRPVNKSKFGTLADGTNITINCKVASNSVSNVGMIKSQRSATKFNVDDAANDGGNEGVCTLVAKAAGSLGANEMSILGRVGGTGDGVFITKLYNRTCRDNNNNRYTYTIDNDSAVSYLNLTAI
tara:strand:+ start:174 stop:548 length:375 start_codon:yes stop_codon:yes gene_type:complete